MPKIRICELAPNLKKRLTDFIDLYHEDYVLHGDATVSFLSEFLEKEKGKKARKDYLQEAESIIKALSAVSEQRAGKAHRIKEYTLRAGKALTRFLRRKKPSEELMRGVEEVISPKRRKIREQLRGIALNKETRDKLEEQLEKHKRGEKLAVQLAESVSKIDESLQNSFCASIAPRLIDASQTAGELKEWANAVIQAIEREDRETRKELIESVLPWPLEHVQRTYKKGGRAKEEIGNFLKLRGEAESEVKKFVEAVGDKKSAYKVFGMVSKKVDGIYEFLNWQDAVYKSKEAFAREFDQNYFFDGILPVLMAKSRGYYELREWGPEFLRCARELREAFGEQKASMYFKTIFLRDLEAAARYWDLRDIITTKITKAREREVEAAKPGEEAKIQLTPKLREAIEKLRRHLTEGLERKYAAAKAKDEYRRMPEWEDVLQGYWAYDVEKDVIGALFDLCKNEKNFLAYANLLLKEDPAVVVSDIRRLKQQGKISEGLVGGEPPAKVLAHFLACEAYDGVAEAFDKIFSGVTGRHDLHAEHPGRELIPAIASSTNIVGVEQILMQLLQKYVSEGERCGRMIAAAYMKAFPKERPQNEGEFKTKLMAALPSNLSEKERARIASVIKYAFVEEWAAAWREEEDAFVKVVVGVKTEEILAALERKAKEHFAGAYSNFLYALPAVVKTRKGRELKEAISFLEPKMTLGGERGLDTRLVDAIFDEMRKAPLEDVKNRINEVEAVLKTHAYGVSEVVVRNIEWVSRPQFPQFLAAVAVVADAAEYKAEYGYVRNNMADINAPNFFGVFVKKHGMNPELMKARLLKIAQASTVLRANSMQSASFFSSDGGASKLIENFALNENFDALADRMVAAYATGTETGNYGVAGLVKRSAHLLEANPQLFSEIFVIMQKEITGLGAQDVSNAYDTAGLLVENIDPKSEYALQNFREGLDMFRQISTIRNAPLINVVSSVFPLFVKNAGKADMKSLRDGYCRVKTTCDEADVREAAAKIREAAETTREQRLGKKQAIKVKPFLSANGYFWSRKKLDFLEQTMKAQRDWSEEKHAGKLNEKFAEVRMPGYMLVCIGAITAKEENIEALRMFLGKKQVREEEQAHYKMAEGLVRIASLENKENVFENIMSVLLPLKGSDVARGVIVLSKISILVNLKNPQAVQEVSETIMQRKITGIGELEGALVDKVEKTLAAALGLTDEKLASFGLTVKNAAAWFEKDERRAAMMAAYIGSMLSKGRNDVVAIAGEVVIHLVKGDYEESRYNNPKAQQQLAVLSEQQRENWRKTMEAVPLESSMTEQEFISYRAQTAKDAVNDSIAHLNKAVEVVEARIKQIDEEIKKVDAAKDGASNKIARLSNERDIISLFLELKGVNYARTLSDAEINQVREKQKSLAALLQASGFNESADDLVRMNQALLSRFSEAKIKATVVETDDFTTLMEIGEEPVRSCQSYLNGAYNECLLAYVIDANKRAIVIKGEDGRVVGRAIIKLFPAEISGEKRNVLIVEPLYASINNPDFVRAVVDYAARKAKSIEAVTVFSSRYGVSVEQKQVKINAPPSNNAGEYSDTYGRKSSANGYTVTISLPALEPKKVKTKLAGWKIQFAPPPSSA